MKKIADMYNIKTSRPIEALDKVSIAELAQYTEFDEIAKYPLAEAYSSLMAQWPFEIDKTSETAYFLSHLDFTSARVFFNDGSCLMFSV